MIHHTTETEVSTVLARNGPMLLFQGFFKQALFLSREDISQFIQDPERAPLLVIPPFASLAVRCYAPWDHIDELVLTRNFSVGENYSLTMRNRGGQAARYYSDHGDMPGPRTLRADRINVVITPKIFAFVDPSGFEPKLSVIVQHAVEEKPSYRTRFAHDVNQLRNAVLRAITHNQPNKHHEKP